MKWDSKLYLCNDVNKKFFGKGPMDLLLKIDEVHSINKAAQSLELSFSKAMSIIHTAEDGFGQELLIKKSGGEGGGGSYLTPFAYETIKKYKEFEQKAKASIDMAYKEVFEK